MARTVIVTGGSKGIGKAICLAFTAPDTQIFFNYSSDISAAEATVKMIGEAGGQASGIKANVSVEKEVSEFIEQVMSQTGRIDVLVNNAGITKDGLLVRMKEKDWDDVIDTNLKGVFLCSKLVAKPMIKQHSGRIINITSVVGAMGNPGQANYVASKAGIIGLTKALARELASRNITVNAVAPGYVDTEMTAGLSDKAKEAMTAQIPLGRVAKPEEIASAVGFLASDKAAYITGQVIHVNGGMYM